MLAAAGRAGLVGSTVYRNWNRNGNRDGHRRHAGSGHADTRPWVVGGSWSLPEAGAAQPPRTARRHAALQQHGRGRYGGHEAIGGGSRLRRVVSLGPLFTCTTRRREALGGGGDSEGAGGLVLSGRVGVRRTRGSAPPDSGSTVAATSTATAKTTLLRRAGWNGCWTWEGAKARLKMVPNLARLACSPSKGDALPALHTGPDRDAATTTTTMAAAPSGGSRSSLVVCSGSSSRSRGWPAGAGAGAAAGRTRWTGGRRLLLLLLFVCSRACTTHVRVCERRPSRTPQGSGL